MKKYLPHLIFVAITLAIMLPLYQSGFVFLLDMVFTPHLDLGSYLKNSDLPASLPLKALIKLFGFVLPFDIIQKIILSLLLFLPGFLMYKLAKLFLPEKWAILSGIFYLLNPFVYERFLAGHWYVLLGYAFFPLLVKFFLEFLEKSDNNSLSPSCSLSLEDCSGLRIFSSQSSAERLQRGGVLNRNFLKFAILFSVFPILSLHWAYIATGFLFVFSIVYFIIKKIPLAPFDKGGTNCWFHSPAGLWNLFASGLHRAIATMEPTKILKFLAIQIVLFLIINSFWLVGFLNPSSTYYKFSLNDFRAFATQADPGFGVFFNVLSLYGFWSTDYFSVKDFSQYWWILSLIILSFAVYGIYQLCFARLGRCEPSLASKENASKGSHLPKARVLGITLTITFIPLVLLSVGYGSEITKPLINFLYTFLPGFKGLRETEKLVGLLAFSYAILVPVGGFAYAKKQKYVFALLVLIPFLSVWTIFWGFKGQLQSSDYPQSWYQTNEILKQDKNNRLLFLPWRGYSRFSFTGLRNIANPAPGFFQVEVVAGENIDNAYLLEYDRGIWDKKMFQLLQGFETLDKNIEFLNSQGITHIVLAKEMDYRRYGFLDESEWLEKILEDDRIILYEIK